MVLTLPPEIWCLIINDLSRIHQLRVCQVSSTLCTLARRTIYDKVTLDSNSPTVHATLALLIRDHSVAHRITCLHIRTFSENTEERGDSSWFNPNALAGMTRLRELRLREFTFRTKEDEEAFTKVMSKSLTSLRNFDYRDLYTRKSVPQGPSAEGYIPKLLIKGLEEIMCIEQDTFTHPSPILTTLTASCPTLVQIHLPIPTSSPSSAELLITFLTLNFPHLSTLHLGGWATTIPVDEVFTTFLLAHPLIGDLQLGFYDMFDDIGCRLSPNVVLGPGALPNLYHLKADAFNVAILARGGVLSLKTIEHLHTSTANGWAVGIFEDMCGALEAYGGLPGLKILKLELEEDDDYPYNGCWIKQLGRLCPSVENFWGDMGVGWTAEESHDIFVSYNNLKLLTLPEITLGVDSTRREGPDNVATFILDNPSMEELRFYMEDYENLITHWFIIERNAEGEISSIVDRLGGHHVCSLDFPGDTCCM